MSWLIYPVAAPKIVLTIDCHKIVVSDCALKTLEVIKFEAACDSFRVGRSLLSKQLDCDLIPKTGVKATGTFNIKIFREAELNFLEQNLARGTSDRSDSRSDRSDSSRVLRVRFVTPVHDGGSLLLDRGPGCAAHLLGNIDTLLHCPEMRHYLGDGPAGLVRLHVTLLLGLAHDDSLGLIRTLDNLYTNICSVLNMMKLRAKS